MFDLDPPELTALLAERGVERYRADQILQWVYGRRVQTFDQMTNLSKALRAELAERVALYTSTVESEGRSEDGTIKLLLRWPDGSVSECVMIPQDDRRTACLSTQVGCPVGCAFCASGIDGLDRNLTAGEIVEQAMQLWQRLPPDERITNVVVMGIGEPLANYDALLSAIRALNASWGLNIGARRITVSTIGLPRQIRRLADEGLQIGLAVSLHAPTDDLRREIVPWADRISIEQLIEAGGDYFDRTGREVTLEYVLLAGVNDRPKHAKQLARVARQIRCNVNLIRHNPVEDLPYEPPSDEAAQSFLKALRREGVNAHLRASRGQDIDAACGQLRRKRP